MLEKEKKQKESIPWRKKLEDIINAFVKLFNNAIYSVFKCACKAAATAYEVITNTKPDIAESVLRGKIESYFSLGSFIFNIIRISSYVAKLMIARVDHNQANLAAKQTMEDFIFTIENMEEGKIQGLLYSLKNTTSEAQDIIKEEIKNLFSNIPFLNSISGNDELKEALAEKIYFLLDLDNSATRDKLGRMIEKFWRKQNRSNEEEKTRQEQKKALKDDLLRMRGSVTDPWITITETTYELDASKLKDRRRKKLAAFLVDKSSVWQEICGESKLKEILETSDISVFVGEFLSFYKKNAEKNKEISLWLQAIFTKKEHYGFNRSSDDLSANLLAFFIKLPSGRRDVVMLQLKALMSGIENFKLDTTPTPSVEETQEAVEKIREELRKDKHSETGLRKLLQQQKLTLQKEDEPTVCEVEAEVNDWRKAYCDLIPKNELQRTKIIIRMHEFFELIKSIPELQSTDWLNKDAEKIKEFLDIFKEEDEYKRKIKLRNFSTKHYWDKLLCEQKEVLSKIYSALSYYISSLKEIKAKKGMYNFRWFNLVAYGSLTLAFLLRFLQFGGIIATVGAFGLTCLIASAFFTLTGAVINLGTSLQGFYQEWHKYNNRVWLGYSSSKKHWEGFKLFFTFGTFGELAGIADITCMGFMFLLFTIVGVTNPLVLLVFFASGLVSTATYILGYMCVNSHRDYKYTAFALDNILAFGGFSTTLVSILFLTGAISIAAISTTGFGAALLLAPLAVYGISSLAVGLFGLYRTPDSWFNKLCNKAKFLFSFKAEEKVGENVSHTTAKESKDLPRHEGRSQRHILDKIPEPGETSTVANRNPAEKKGSLFGFGSWFRSHVNEDKVEQASVSSTPPEVGYSL